MSYPGCNLLLKSPRDFSCVVLDKWISPKDFLQLDTAFCNHVHRTDFLELVAAREFTLTSTKSNPTRNFALFCKWVVKRQVKLSHLEIGISLPHISWSSIELLLTRCGSTIRTLFISNRSVTDYLVPCFDLIAVQCRRLEELTIDVQVLPQALHTILANNDKSLRILKIASYKWHIDFSETLHLPELTELRLGKFEVMSAVDAAGATSLQHFVYDAPKLEKVFIKTSYVHGAGLDALALCKSLREITLEVTFTNALSIIAHCPRGLPVNLQHFNGVISPRVHEVFSCGLNIHSIDLSTNVVKDETLHLIALHCPQLTTLALARTQMFSTHALSAVVRSCKHLTSLDLSRCVHLRSEDLAPLMSECAGLTTLYLDGVPLRDAVLVMIGQHLHKLKMLSLSRNVSFQNVCFSVVGLRAVLRGCPELVRAIVHEPPLEVRDLLGPLLSKY